MKFKTIFLITVVLSLLGIFFLMFNNQPLVYMLYGYDPAIIGGSELISYEAFNKTRPALRGLYFLSVVITLLCFIFSCAALYRRIYLKYYLTQIGFVLSLLILLLYGIALTVTRGMLG